MLIAISVTSEIKSGFNLIALSYSNEVSFVRLFIFASERFILKKIIASNIIGNNILESDIKQLEAFEAINLNLENNKFDLFSFKKNLTINKQKSNTFQLKKGPNKFSLIKDHTKCVKELIRCTKCVLPETYPFIDFD